MAPSALGVRLRALSTDPAAGASVRRGAAYLRSLFGHATAPDADLAVAALIGARDEEEIRHLAPAFVTEVLDAAQLG